MGRNILRAEWDGPVPEEVKAMSVHSFCLNPSGAALRGIQHGLYRFDEVVDESSGFVWERDKLTCVFVQATVRNAVIAGLWIHGFYSEPYPLFLPSPYPKDLLSHALVSVAH